MIVLVSAIVLLCVYAWLVEPMAFQFKKLRVSLPGQPVRVLFVSDLHMGRGRLWIRYAHLLKLLQVACKKYAPDAILLGGDYLDFDTAYLPQLARFLEGLKALGLPLFAVLGDHDHKKIDPQIIKDTLERHSVRVLEDESVSLAGQSLFGVKELRFDPVYDVRKMGQRHDAASREKIRQRVREFQPEMGKKPLIVLSHNPDAIYLKQIPVGSLVIAGHTHGGQIWPLTWMGEKTWKFVPGGTFGSWSGQTEIEGKTLVISNGAGCSGWPFRFGCRPDFLLIETEGV